MRRLGSAGEVKAVMLPPGAFAVPGWKGAAGKAACWAGCGGPAGSGVIVGLVVG
jgi:hypothetical protein